MIVGTTICIMSALYLQDDQPCAVERENVIAGGLLYGSYLYLFGDFFVKRFVFGANGNKKGGVAAATGATAEKKTL